MFLLYICVRRHRSIPRFSP